MRTRTRVMTEWNSGVLRTKVWHGLRKVTFHALPKIAIGMNDPVSSRLDPLLFFLHGFLTAEHPQGELIHPGLHHGSKLPLHKTVLPVCCIYIIETDHGFFSVPLYAHGVAVVFHVLAPHVVLQYGVLPLKHVIPIRLLIFVAGERIGFVFHVLKTHCLREGRTDYAQNSRGAAGSSLVSFDVLQLLGSAASFATGAN